MDSVASTPASQPQGQQQPTGQNTTSSHGPQVRARITVVCGECKRLKLKCDRKNPCGSCEKRDTVPRCVYSAAAAEKVDLHSLNNRVTALESQMAHINSASPQQHQHQHNTGLSGPGLPPPDRALLAVGHSGCSLIIPSEDVTKIWLEDIGLNHELLPVLASSDPKGTGERLDVKQEPTSTSLSDELSSGGKPAALLTPSPALYYTHNPSAYEAPSVTTDLVALLLPPGPKRGKLWNHVQDILAIHPTFFPRAFKARIDAMFAWAADPDNAAHYNDPRKALAARILNHAPTASSRTEPLIKPTLSFFAATAAAFALGAQASAPRSGRGDDAIRSSKKPSGPSGSGKKAKTVNAAGTTSTSEPKSTPGNMNPAVLFAVSEQALDLFEKSNTYDLDFLIALTLRALYMLHDGKPSVDHRLLPLVGKMVNIARMMGLGTDPDEFPGKCTVFEAESRRRIWWDVYCYDLYVSDCMGQPPSITDNSFTTRLPADIDEAFFGPSSSSVPSPAEDDHTSRFFGHKIRLAQLVKNVKKRLFRDPSSDFESEAGSIDDTHACHKDVKQFLNSLPPAFHLDSNTNVPNLAASPAVSPERSTIVAQQCKLAMTAQYLILKIYLPYLRSPNLGSSSHSQATSETVNAAHGIVHASRVLHALYKQSHGDELRWPGPAVFEHYAYGQALFSAAVVCAHSVITDPSAIWAKEGLKDIAGSLEVMKDPMVASGRGAAHIGGTSEAVRVVEILKAKAEAAVAGGASATGSKRKHSELEDDVPEMPAGFQLPYAGPAVASSGTAPKEPSREEPVILRQETPAVERHRSPSPEADRCSSTVDKSKSKEKKLKPPVHGVRKRSAENGPPYMREKFETAAPPSASNISELELRLPPSNSNASTPVPTSQFTYPMSEQVAPAYQEPLSADLMPPPPSDYQAFSTLPSQRRYSVDHGHQAFSPAAIDQSQGNFQGTSSSPPSYDTGSSGQSPVSAGTFSTNSGPPYMPSSMSSAIPYPPQSYSQHYGNGGQHISLSIPIDGLNGGATHAPYDDVKPYSANPPYQAYDQNHAWDQSHSTDIRGGASQQFWQPQNPYYS